MSSVYFSDDIRENCENCEDFDTFIDECVDDYISTDETEPKAYDVPTFLYDDDDYDDSLDTESCIIEITTDDDGDMNVHYSSDKHW